MTKKNEEDRYPKHRTWWTHFGSLPKQVEVSQGRDGAGNLIELYTYEGSIGHKGTEMFETEDEALKVAQAYAGRRVADAYATLQEVQSEYMLVRSRLYELLNQRIKQREDEWGSTEWKL